MTTRIAIISDTHFSRWDEVHPRIREAVREADIAVHCGDIVRQDVVDGMRGEARRAVIVHGNSDPPDLRQSLPYTEVIEVEGSQAGRDAPRMGRARISIGRAAAGLSQTRGRDSVRAFSRDHQRNAGTVYSFSIRGRRTSHSWFRRRWPG